MRNSLFSHHLLEGLRGAAHERGDGVIRILDLFHHVAERVKTQAPQHPVLKADDLQDNFPLALYPGDNKTVAAPNGADGQVFTDDNWWRTAEDVASELYPLGPTDAEVWSRAGGDLSRLKAGLSGRASWHAALRFLRLGGGGSISIDSLLAVMQDDYPNHLELAKLQTP